MAINISQLNSNTASFGDWFAKTNQIANAISTSALSIGTNPTGDVILPGNFQSNAIFVTQIAGGAANTPGNLTITTNTTLQATSTFSNTVFQGANNALGLVANLSILGSNTSHFILAANTTSNKLRFTAIPKFEVTPPTSANGSILAYNATAGEYVNTDAFVITVSNGNVVAKNDFGVTSNLSVSGNTALTGNTTITGRLTVANTSTFASMVSANNLNVTTNNVAVSSQMTVSNNFFVTGNTTLTRALAVANNVNVDGAIFATGDITGLSDRRVKTEIKQIQNALERVKGITGYTFYINGSKNRKTGVIAQEVQEVLPEAVITENEFLTVAYGNMVGLLVEAIKELDLKIQQIGATDGTED